MTYLKNQSAILSEADLTFVVPTEPKPWARARKQGNKFFKDEQTERVERTIQTWAVIAMRGREIFDGAISLTVISILPIPSSWSDKKRQAALAGDIRPTSKPDWDNFGKIVSDALSKIVYHDDGQIVDGRSILFYGAKPEIQIAVRSVQQAGQVIQIRRGR